jgi:hypothetical protein
MATRTSPNQALAVRPFRAEELHRLLAPSNPPCVSIYVPTHRTHPGWKQDPVRFRALVGEAKSLLDENHVAREADRFVEPLRALEGESHWEHSLDGLAVFLSPTIGAAYRLPIQVPERAVVAETFHLKPLIRFLGSNRRYFVLALSQNSAALYEGSPYGAGAVDLGGMPANLREALGGPDVERTQGMHGRQASLIFHGRGFGREDTKEILLRYFRAVDKGLRDFLRDERAPLVLAAVRYYHAIYHEANTYPHLLPEGLDGNYERVNGSQIHADAWPLVSGAFGRQVEAWAARYRSLAGTGLTAEGIEEIALAAIGGRVRCLLAAEGEVLWGRLDRSTGAVTRHAAKAGPDDDDVLDDICEESLKRGGEVYVVPRAAMPTAGALAAVLRF